MFFNPADRDKYFEIFNEILIEHDIDIHAYCLMTNHVHLLVKRNDLPLHTFMKRLNTSYALYFNHIHKVVGHVFQDRYKSMIVLDEVYLMHLVKYIHMNPVKAKMCEDALEYELSSASYYEGKKEKNIADLQTLNIFKSTQDYIDFMEAGPDEFPTFKDSIGNEIAYINFDKRHDGREKGISKEKREDIKRTQERCEELLQKQGLSLSKLKEMKYSRGDREVLKKALRSLLGAAFTRADIARLLDINRSTVGRILKK